MRAGAFVLTAAFALAPLAVDAAIARIKQILAE
jgi:hypothetical protein